MYKLLLSVVLFSLTACASTNNGMKLINKSPRGLSIINITAIEQAKAFREAEKHCATYYKAPRILGSEKTPSNMRTTHYECLKPAN